MACFTVPLAEAVAISAVRMFVLKQSSGNEMVLATRERLGSLEKMLYGGSLMFALEHVVNGEITAAFPFFTAFNSVESTTAMFHEMATLGVGMSLLMTGTWAVWLSGTHFLKKWRARKAFPQTITEGV